MRFYQWGELMEYRRLSAFGAIVAVMALAACGRGVQTTSVPAANDSNSKTPRFVSERAKRFSAAMSSAMAASVDSHIQQEAARGARVFRINQVAVVDPATGAHIVTQPDQVEQTADGIIVFPGPNQIMLSKQAKIVTSSYGYIFRHGKQRDPDPKLHAVRIK